MCASRSKSWRKVCRRKHNVIFITNIQYESGSIDYSSAIRFINEIIVAVPDCDIFGDQRLSEITLVYVFVIISFMIGRYQMYIWMQTRSFFYSIWASRGLCLIYVNQCWCKALPNTLQYATFIFCCFFIFYYFDHCGALRVPVMPHWPKLLINKFRKKKLAT